MDDIAASSASGELRAEEEMSDPDLPRLILRRICTTLQRTCFWVCPSLLGVKRPSTASDFMNFN
jgi:hypothetical protein